jgi:hypothetical protein
MNDNSFSWLVTCGVCCVYPILVNVIGAWLWKRIKFMDWQGIRLPWRKDS